jgi:hypothetical protein
MDLSESVVVGPAPPEAQPRSSAAASLLAVTTGGAAFGDAQPRSSIPPASTQPLKPPAIDFTRRYPIRCNVSAASTDR